jgi:uncharacterized protein (DUF4415 family)
MSKTYWNEDEQSGVIEVTPEDYADARARGLSPDETLRPGQHRFERGGFLKRHGLTPAEVEAASVQIEIKLPLDSDVLDYFQQRAAAVGAESCQSYINQALRQLMENERHGADLLAPVKQQLLADQQFIGALAAEVAARAKPEQAA